MTDKETNPPRMADLTIHERFNYPDADVAILSCDQVLFKIHSRNLSVCSAAFPQGDHHWSEGEPAVWEEPSHVLEILFAYIYSDQAHPFLSDLSLTQVIEIGAAAHKWMIPGAIAICQTRIIILKEQVAKSPPEENTILPAFAYAVKHHGMDTGMTALIDQVGMWTVGCTAKSAMQYLGSGRVYNAWADHRAWWSDAVALWA
ncbi:hypothetical protein DL96DRAFT_773195 [Flagelloscypha sp. PMI_526]|nr:hypothetical protein DL96DRAFT_773195 [Flagelloscypha sp. PMI_526]